MDLLPFHLAVPADDLSAAWRFYVDLLGCGVGRESEDWIDFDFFGHQLTVHKVAAAEAKAATNTVDGEQVPVRHFGIILPPPEWEALAKKLEAAAVDFLIPPQVRFAGEVGEQRTLFLCDPAGNGLEFKSFADPSRIFARDDD